MVQKAITRLEDILHDVSPALFEMNETELSRKPIIILPSVKRTELLKQLKISSLPACVQSSTEL